MFTHLAAAAGAAPFNIAGLTTFLGSLGGLAVTALGVGSIVRAHGQQAHRHVMGSAAVGIAGLAIMGISMAGLTGHLATNLAHLFVA